MADSSQPDCIERTEEECSIYRDERKVLLGAEQEAAKAFDWWILTLSGGALVVSITFIKDLVLPHPIQSAVFLLLSWILFALAIALTLVCIQQSQSAHEKYREILDEEFVAGRPKFLHHVRVRQGKLWRPGIIDWLNRVSLVFFVLGIVSLSWFAYRNTNKMEFVNGQSQTSDRH